MAVLWLGLLTYTDMLWATPLMVAVNLEATMVPEFCLAAEAPLVVSPSWNVSAVVIGAMTVAIVITAIMGLRIAIERFLFMNFPRFGGWVSGVWLCMNNSDLMLGKIYS